MKIAHIEWEKKPRTLGKVQKIRDLEGVGLFHPFKNTRYMTGLSYFEQYSEEMPAFAFTHQESNMIHKIPFL